MTQQIPLPPVWIQTSSGLPIRLDKPFENRYEITDIAHALSNICRFVGHTREFYSVAQHSVLVSQHVPIPVAMDALLHDAAEAYLGDLAHPTKQFCPGYIKLEEQFTQAISESFDISYPIPDVVKTADRRAFTTEVRDLMMTTDHIKKNKQVNSYAPFKERIIPVDPDRALRMFIDRYETIQTEVALWRNRTTSGGFLTLENLI